jgi:hypothetical protein
VAYNFPNNVAIEDAHDANRECNMVETGHVGWGR